MSLAKTEEIKIRVPSALKEAVKSVADGRFTSESEIVREAIIAYLNARDPAVLRDANSTPALAAAEAQAVQIAQQEISSYRKAAKKKPAK